MNDKGRKSNKVGKLAQVAGSFSVVSPISSSSHARAASSGASALSTSKKAQKRSAVDENDNDSDDSSAKKPKKAISERGYQDKATKEWICSECDRRFELKRNLNRHFLIMHEDNRPRSFVCEICQKAFKKSQHLKQHEGVHSDVRMFKCNYLNCDKEFKRTTDLDNHIKFNHQNIRDKSCSLCYMVFLKTSHLNQHMKAVHDQEREHVCCHCDEKFKIKSALRRHIENIHFDIKNHECEDCHCRFYEKFCFVKHQMQRYCRFCVYSSTCYQSHMNHEAQHSFICDQCEISFNKVGDAKNHCKKHLSPMKSIGVNKKQAPLKGNDHFEKVIESSKCNFCNDESEFMFKDSICFVEHLKKFHEDINVCQICGKVFETPAELLSHSCTGKFDGSIVKCFNLMQMSPDQVELKEQSIPSCFADEHGIINKIIPGWPLQATCSIDASRNFLQRTHCDGSTSLMINQNQNLIQNGSSAILTWCSDINTLSYATEKIEWIKNSDNVIVKPIFTRKNIVFSKDAQDVLYEVSCKLLTHPYDLGHARAAGNCFTEEDFKASFSNLNFWPMYFNLNRNYWRNLEKRIRDEAKQYKCVYVTTGAIFRKDGKFVAKYINGIIVPCAFYKVAVFERNDGQYMSVVHPSAIIYA